MGVFACVLPDAFLVRPDAETGVVEAIATELEVPAVYTTVGGSGTVGALVTGNKNGILISNRATEREKEAIVAESALPITELPGRINAAGNVVLANNNGAYVHPDLSSEAIEAIRTALEVPVETGSLADVRTVGTAGVATDSGVLCHPKSREAELESLEALLDARADIGTINYGGQLIGSGLLAAKYGYVVGEETTGPELTRIEETLGYLEPVVEE